MAATEHNGLMTYVDEGGNKYLLYPITKGENVVGAVENSGLLGGKPPAYYLSPRNLIVNGDFTNPVNQRGAASYTGSKYAIDMWRTWEDAATVKVSDGYITHTEKLYQYVPALDAGSVYTFAVCNTAGEVIVHTGKPEDGKSTSGVGLEIEQDGYPRVWIGGEVSAVRWAALYEGEYTAETLPPYVPKGYAAELADCQVYFIRMDNKRTDGGHSVITHGAKRSSNWFQVSVAFPTVMRDDVLPTVSYEGARAFLSGIDTSSAIDVSSITVAGYAGNTILLNVYVDSAIVGNYENSALQISPVGYLSLSAEL